MSWTDAGQSHEEFAREATNNNDGSWLQHYFSCDLWEIPLGATAGHWIHGVTNPNACFTPCCFRVIFAPLDLPAKTTRDDFLTLYRGLGVPSSFSLERVKSVCHSFGSLSDSSSTRTWFHFLCKNINITLDPETGPEVAYHSESDAGNRQYGYPGQPRLPQADYSWLRSGYFLRASEKGCTTLVCFGATHRVEERLKAFLHSDSVGDAIAEPRILLDLVIEGLWQEVEQQVHNMQKVLGVLEHRILELANKPGQRLNSSKAQFVGLHNLAKHIVYLSEAVESCLLLVDSIKCEVEKPSSSTSTTSTPNNLSSQLLSSLMYRRSLFQATKLLLSSLSGRINNAINLAFNVVTLSDSMLMLQDSRVMKIIAAITILFLPATAVATVAGSQLFLTEFEEGTWSIKGTPLFSIFWWISIPLTLVVALVGWTLHRREGFISR